MAYNDEWMQRLAQQEKEREEQLQQLKLEQQLKFKQMDGVESDKPFVKTRKKTNKTKQYGIQ